MVNDIPFGFGLPDPDDPDKPSDAPADPFGALLGGAGGADLGAALQRFGQLLSTSSGPVHWQLAHDTARQLVAAEGDPSVSAIERAQVTEAVEIAEVWLDDATTLPSTGATPRAWSRSEWIEETLPRWKSLVMPLAERMAQASAEALPTQMPEEMRAMAAPLMGMMGQMSGVMFGGQVGQGLGALAQEVLTSTDVGVPLAPSGVVALVPRNVDRVRQRARGARRPGAHLPCAPRVRARPALPARAVADVPDRGGARRLRARDLGRHGRDRTRHLAASTRHSREAMAELMSSGVFEPPTTPEQQAALDRLEHLLALVEGWVDDVTSTAADTRLPAATALGETMRRRRASGGPAEHTFETLVGLNLRPRRLREASALWRAMAEHGSMADRDHLWSHPDLLPDAADLDDPTAFATRTSTTDWDISTLTDTEPPDDESPTPA